MSAGGGGWETIPAMTAAAAERFGDAAGRRRRRHPRSPTPSCSSRRARSAPRWWPRASRRVIGWPSGRSTAPSGSSPCSACSRPAPCWCRSTPGSRASRRPTSSGGAGPGSWSPSPTSSAPTTWRCSATTGVDLPDLDTIVVARGPAPAAPPSRGPAFLGRATAEARAEVRPALRCGGSDDPSDILFTSGTTGVPKGVVQTHGRTLRVATDWVAMTGLTAGDRYLMVNPYFHMFGLKAGILASVAAGATMLPEAVFDVDRALARVADEAVTVLPGRTRPVPGHPRPPRPRPLRPVEPAGGGHGRGRHPRRADPPGRRGAALLDDHHRLRPHRGRHGLGHLARRRRRDHRHHRRAAPPRLLACATTCAASPPRADPWCARC